MRYYKIETYIPLNIEDTLMETLNNKGILQEGPYDYVYASVQVMGHWRPLDDANPFSGEKNAVSSEPELRVEFRIKQTDLKATLKTISEVHPYETPVINVSEVLDWQQYLKDA